MHAQDELKERRRVVLDLLKNRVPSHYNVTCHPRGCYTSFRIFMVMVGLHDGLLYSAEECVDNEQIVMSIHPQSMADSIARRWLHMFETVPGSAGKEKK